MQGLKQFFLCHIEFVYVLAVDVALVHRLLNPLGFAAGQLAVFQGASEAPLSES
jgi:hypothetical protein